MSDERKGYAYHVTDEQLRKYRQLSVEEKLTWLEEANAFITMFQTERARRLQKLLRRGAI